MSSRLEQKFNSKKNSKKFKIQIQKPHFNSKRGVAEYFGETGRNAFTRGEEHLLNKQAEDENKSALKPPFIRGIISNKEVPLPGEL